MYYGEAKKAREAMKAKARRLAGEKNQKVDSSDWTPAEPLNADVKTGMRPISRRAYKSGGKVTGPVAKVRADKAPRNNGDKAEAKQFAIATSNSNKKEANESRDGIKHIGGMKKGGRAEKNDGGTVPLPPKRPSQAEIDRLIAADEKARLARSAKDLNRLSTEGYRKELESAGAGANAEYKKGGRAKKELGGPLAGASKMMEDANKTSGVPSKVITPTSFRGDGAAQVSPYKKGGKAKWEGSAADEAQDKKLAKKHGMSMKEWESSKMDEKHDKQQSAKGLKKGGRLERKSGGRAKPKTDIKINIIAGKPAMPEDMMPLGQMGAPGGLPILVPPPAGAPMGGAPSPMPQMPAGAPPMPVPPPGGMPMPRKRGGRTIRSTKDLTAGAGSGEGRLQKTELQARKR
jgi:hypothetical protein